ncbi:MAG: DEAD/DEAH box helicase [archaeon]
MAKTDDGFSLLAKPVREAALERGFRVATEPQQKAFPLILAGKNVLLVAATASGKTESAMLPILSLYLTSQIGGRGIKMLYITPLKALNRDLMERLEWWCKRLDIRVAVRHGDTEQKERSGQARIPPDLLITTPETLQAILPGRIMSQHLRAVRWVVVDEVHEFAEDKRGSQLSLALERLRWVVGRDFQIVGLSATIGSAEKVASYLVGRDRAVEIVKIPIARKMTLKVIYPEPSPADYELSTELHTHPEVAARLRIMRRAVESHSSVLLFTNTRSTAEVLASRFRLWDADFPVSIHHGSLAKLSRITAERELKNGEIKGLVCTSSLELGIDVGRIDYVIQYMSPRQVSRLIQRIGRSGHSMGRAADGIIIAMDSDDALEAMVIVRRAYSEDLEPVIIPYKPLDVLAHQVVGLLTHQRRWNFRDILELFTKAYPYRDLTEKDLEGVLTYMHERYPRLVWVSFEDKVVLRPLRSKETYEYYFNRLSMIPDEKHYLVVDNSTDTPVGILDEAFVAENGEPGTKFIIRGSSWRITGIIGDKIQVSPISDPTGAIPSWTGEEIPVPYEVAIEVGEIRRTVAQKSASGVSKKQIANELAGRYRSDPEDMLRALSETFEHLDRGIPVPSDTLLTVEDWDDYIVMNAHLGTLVNRTLARLIGHVISEETGHTVAIQQDAYHVILQTEGSVDATRIASLMSKLSERDIENDLKKASIKTGLFKRRMLHVAKRFGAISKRATLGSAHLSQAMKALEDTAIMDEALKETLEKDLDVPNTKKIMKKIVEGAITVLPIKNLDGASPLSSLAIEKIGRRGDLVPPERMESLLLQSIRVRILNEARTLVCTSCWNYVETRPLKSLKTIPRCPICKSRALGVLTFSEEQVREAISKRRKRHTAQDERIISQSKESAELVEKFGKAAALVFGGRGIDSIEAEDVLQRESRISEELFELILNAEREVLRDRFLR